MKILIISNLYPPKYLGGYEILCCQVTEELVRRGHDVVVLTSTYDKGEEFACNEPSNVHRLLELYIPFGSPGRLLRSRRWRTGRKNHRITQDFIRKVNPDIVFLWSQLRLTLGPIRAALESNYPLAFTFNDENIAGFIPSSFKLLPRLLARYIFDNWVFPSITLTDVKFRYSTCISQRLKDNLLTSGVGVENARVIYQGIPIEQFPLKPDPGSIHTQPRLLYVGQLLPYKGVHTLIEAAHKIAALEEYKDVKVSIVGDGEDLYKEQLVNLAAEGPAVITFYGRVNHSDLSRIYHEHDILVFPSIWQEPFGLSHLEAMASGVPVVSTNDGGHGEFLEDNINSLVFNKSDVNQLVSCLKKILHDEPLRKRLTSTARTMIEERFTMQGYVSMLEEFLKESQEQQSQ